MSGATPEPPVQPAGMTIVHAAIAQPGDTLLIGVRGPRSAQELQDVADKLRAMLPTGVDVVILDDVQAVTVIRPSTVI